MFETLADLPRSFHSHNELDLQDYLDSLKHTEWQSGEKKLMAALLEDAVYTLRQQVGVYGGASQTNRKGLKQRLADEARRWFDAKDEGYIFGFVSCCESLGICPEWFRRVLRMEETSND